MGFLNDFMNAAKDVAQNINEERQAREQARLERGTGNPNFDNPPPALPARPVQTTLNNHTVQFMLSQDFIDDAGYMGTVISFKYCPPGFENEYINDYERYGKDSDYDPNEIKIYSISLFSDYGEFDEIITAFEEYKNYGDISDSLELIPFENGNYLFKTVLNAGNYIEHIYVFRDGFEDIESCPFLLLFYESKIRGTKLEQKLISSFNGVANSLTIN